MKLNYELFISTGVQHEKDAEFVNSMARDIASSSKQMKEVIDEAANAMENLSAATEVSAENSEKILSR